MYRYVPVLALCLGAPEYLFNETWVIVGQYLFRLQFDGLHVHHNTFFDGEKPICFNGETSIFIEILPWSLHS